MNMHKGNKQLTQKTMSLEKIPKILEPFVEETELVGEDENIQKKPERKRPLSSGYYIAKERKKRIEAEEMIFVDSLSGVYNKHFFDQEFPKLLAGERRQGKNCAMIVVDADHFKEANDKYGHAEGDKLLKELALVIGKSIRSGDHCLRYGGDEFVVLLMDTKQGDVQTAAERMRSNIELAMRNNSKEVQITGSIGYVDTKNLSEWAEGVSNEEMRDKMFAMADAAMYGAKEGGKNQVTEFDPDNEEMVKRYENNKCELDKKKEKQ